MRRSPGRRLPPRPPRRQQATESLLMADAATFISMRGIGKSFGSVRALSDVNLTIATAEVLGIVGHNGAGKSTLMGVLRGTVPRGEGALLVDGAAVAETWDVREAGRLGGGSVVP